MILDDSANLGAPTPDWYRMARMTPGEANAVNVLLGYLAGQDTELPVPVVNALEILASRAHNRIQTGWDENAVRKQWPHAYEEVPGDTH